ncbi:MAG: ABC transporter ATP-binding protein [Rikenellaceae bacterium]|nr:ABC transporter ATP-binding protein [Rikenellaceae bacterium]
MGLKAEICGAVPLFAEFRFAHPVDWRIAEGENWAVVGPNGAGKTMLADLLLRRIPLKEGRVEVRTDRTPYEAVRMIGFRDIYSIIDSREGYYQQRWNADGRAAPCGFALPRRAGRYCP